MTALPQEAEDPKITVQDLLKQMPGASVKQALQALSMVDPYIWTMLMRRLKAMPTTYDVTREIALAQDQGRTLATILERHRPFLIQPLCDMTQHKVYKKGRQVGVSELGINEVFWFLTSHPNTKWIYTFPREKQLMDFSNTRFAEALKESPAMKKILGVPNQTYTKKIGQSFLILRSAWESNLGEGVDGDGVTFDEVDRMRENVNIAFEESLQSSPYKFVREVSTPTLPGRGVDKSFSMSCQYHWFVRCIKCQRWQMIKWPANVIQMKDIPPGAKSLEEGTYDYLCSTTRCRGKLDRLQGEWVPKYRDRVKDLSGYHMPQTITVWQDATQLMNKKLKYRILSKWLNYCLAETSVGDSTFVTEEMMMRCIAPGHMLTNVRGKQWSHVVVGIDWGARNWVLVVARNAYNGRRYVIGRAEIEDSPTDPTKVAREVFQFVAPFEPDCIVADSGYGRDRNAALASQFPEKFFACYYNPSDKHDRGFAPSFHPKTFKVLCDRTVTIKTTVQAFRQMEIGLPSDPEFVDEMTRHFLSLAPQLVEEDGKVYESIEATDDDHYVHATGYALLALDYVEGGMNDFQAFW